jgi:hypothetical protein
MWDFASSGLETGLQFAWLGVCVLLLSAPQRERRRWVPAVAVFIGLGPLIRPDLALFTIGLLAVLVGPRPYRWRRQASTIGAALAVPFAYQLFRMGFFATLVPNTALAKNASSLRVGQGLRYLREAVGSYQLWGVLLAAAAAYALLVVRPLRAGERPARCLLWRRRAAAHLATSSPSVAITYTPPASRRVRAARAGGVPLSPRPAGRRPCASGWRRSRWGRLVRPVPALRAGTSPASSTDTTSMSARPHKHPITIDDYRSDNGGLVLP